MNLVKPQILSQGDTIEIIAPAGQVEYDQIMTAKNYFESKGFRVKLGEHIFDMDRYLAGVDEARVQDLHNAFLDEEVKGIICARGGYGAIRLIKMIDFEIIRSNPKFFCGYSDITALSAMFLKHSGLITFSGPMAQSDFNTYEPQGLTEESFFKALEGIPQNYYYNTIYKTGHAEGITFGGNLSTLVSLCGIDFIPDKDFIFFAEDINEPVYKLDKMFQQLINIKKFRQNIKGIAFGEFIGVDDEHWLEQLLKEVASLLDVPAYGGFSFTHGPAKQTIPFGACAKLKSNGNLILL